MTALGDMVGGSDEDAWKDEDFLSFDAGSRSPPPPPPTTTPNGGTRGGAVGLVASPPFSSPPLFSNSDGRQDTSDNEEDDDDDDDEHDEGRSSLLPPWMDDQSANRTEGAATPATAGRRHLRWGEDGNSSTRGAAAAAAASNAGVHFHEASPHALGLNPLVRLHNEIVGYARLVEPTPRETATRQQLVERVRQLAVREFGDVAQVLVFGSQATGLFLPTSDIDLVIVTKSEQDLQKDKERKDKDGDQAAAFDPTPLRRFAAAVRDAWEATSELSYLEVIENTRVPLVKFTHGPTRVSIDVSFDLLDSGPPAAKLMNTYLEALPPLRPLTLVAKSFLAARGLNQPYTGGVGSYMLQIMIVAFLQQRERDAVIHHRRPSLNLGALLMDFFELYGLDFNYVTTGVSVRNDGFFFPKGAPTKRDWFCIADRPQLMALENPLDTTQDVGKSSFRISMVQRAFKVAHNVLLSHVSDPPVGPAPANSILAAILPPTSDMVRRGRWKRREARRRPMGAGAQPQQQPPPPLANQKTATAVPVQPTVDQPLSSKRYSRNDSPPSSAPDPRKRQRR
jgi:non-canonical poly(A) RNA polymerase PAPD5/7